jgi:hypothetical protein
VAVRGRAQEPAESELEFVRQLRGKGYLDLAKAYLEKMQARKDPKLAGILPLEQARTLLAAAREKDAEQRFGIFGQAREFLKDYTQQNAGKPAAAQGTLELARLSTYEGQALLTKALRELDPAAQQDLAKPAEAKFNEAAAELESALKLLQSLIDDAKVSEETKKQLKQEQIQARFDKGINFIDQARTYVNTSKEDLNLKRAQIVAEAKKVFDTLREEEELGIRSQANAWLMKIAMEQQDPNEIEKYYNRVMGYKGAEANAGKRWVQLFDMQDALTNGKNPRAAKTKTAMDKLDIVKNMGLKWLKDYPGHTKALEGQGVLWELANAYYMEAKEAEKEKKAKIAPDKLYDEAQKYFAMLAQSEGDYSEKANQVNLSISFQRMGAKKEYRTFEELYLKGQFELIELRNLANKRMEAQAKGDAKDAEKYDKDWKAKLRQVTSTFSRGISLANEHTPIQKVDEARYYLASAYLFSGDLQRAAIAGEALGRTKPPTRRAPSGAGYAIDAYANLLGRENTEGTKERLRTVIEYVLSPESQKLWSSDPVTGVARYQMALLANRDGDFKTAINELKQLPREFPAYTYAQGQLVFIALKARRDNQNLSAKEKTALADEVRAAIARMPALPNDADSTTAFMYYLAQLEKSKLLYADAYPLLEAGEPLKAAQKYKEMAKFVQDLSDRFEKSPIKLTEKNRETIDFELHIMRKYADLGLAEVEYRENHFDDVLKVTQPVVDAVKKADDGKGPIKLKDYQVTGDILGLALRAEVRKGNVQEAKALLDRLKRLADEGDQKPDANAESPSDRVVRNLLTEISAQVVDLKKRDKKEELKKVVGSFTGFLDTLMKDVDLRKMPLNERVILARAFTGLEQHKKAAELYAQVQQPKLLDDKRQIKDFSETEQRELADFWSLKWEQVKALRAAKDFIGALKVLDGTKDEVGWLKHPKKLFAMPQGEMEKNFILEDDAKYGAATMGWNAFTKSLNAKAGSDPKMEKLYFEGYFYATRTLFKYGLHDPAVKDKNKVLSLAVKRIIDLEFSKSRRGWELVGDMFEKLLQDEPILKQEYDRQKKLRVAAGN